MLSNNFTRNEDIKLTLKSVLMCHLHDKLVSRLYRSSGVILCLDPASRADEF